MSGVEDLVQALAEVQARFELDAISGSRRLPDGHSLTLRLVGARLLEIEREDGEVVLVDRGNRR